MARLANDRPVDCMDNPQPPSRLDFPNVELDAFVYASARHYSSYHVTALLGGHH
jgi:hypothetical protein